MVLDFIEMILGSKACLQHLEKFIYFVVNTSRNASLAV